MVLLYTVAYTYQTLNSFYHLIQNSTYGVVAISGTIEGAILMEVANEPFRSLAARSEETVADTVVVAESAR